MKHFLSPSTTIEIPRAGQYWNRLYNLQEIFVPPLCSEIENFILGLDEFFQILKGSRDPYSFALVRWIIT